MALKLTSATQIQDFLKSQGKPFDIQSRKKLFSESGLSKRLGQFVGSESQNRALLKSAQQSVNASIVPLAPTPVENPALNTVQTINGTPPVSATALTPGQFGTPPKPNLPDVLQPGEITKPEAPASQPEATQQIFKTPSGAEVDIQGNIVTPPPKGTSPEQIKSEQIDVTTKGAVGISASDLIPDLPGDESDLINNYFNSSEGRLAIDRAQLKGLTLSVAADQARQELESKYATERKQVEDSLSSRGLFLSGIRTTQIKGLIDSLATSKLGVDRELATKLLDANLDLRESIISGVSDLFTDAKEGRKEALAQLNKAGFAVVGNQVVSTQEAIKTELQQARDAIGAARSEEDLKIARRKLELAEEKAAKESIKKDFQIRDIGGRTTQIFFDAEGKETHRVDLGPAGDQSEADRKAVFAQAVGALEANEKTKAELRQTALQLGLNPDDPDVSDIIGRANTTSGVRRALGF